MSMRLDKFTVKAQEALQAAEEQASRRGQQQVEPVHLLLARVGQPEGIVPAVLEKLGVQAPLIERGAERAADKLPRVSGGERFFSQSMSRALEQALEETKLFKDEFVSTEHLFLALTRLKGDDVQLLLEGVDLLDDRDRDVDVVLLELEDRLGIVQQDIRIEDEVLEHDTERRAGGG